MLNVGGPAASVTGWTSPEFSQHCWFTEPFYLRGASWSPDDADASTAYFGGHERWSQNRRPR